MTEIVSNFTIFNEISPKIVLNFLHSKFKKMVLGCICYHAEEQDGASVDKKMKIQNDQNAIQDGGEIL